MDKATNSASVKLIPPEFEEGYLEKTKRFRRSTFNRYYEIKCKSVTARMSGNDRFDENKVCNIERVKETVEHGWGIDTPVKRTIEQIRVKLTTNK